MTWTPPPSLPPVEQWRTEDGIQCLECGRWMRQLGRHLPTHGLDAATYRARWGMRQRQPLSCGEVSSIRREIAVRTGGPERLTSFLPQVSDRAHEAARSREWRPQEQAVTVPRMTDARLLNAASRRQAIRDRAVEGTGLSFERWAEREYSARGRTIRDLAAEVGASHTMMNSMLRDAGVVLRRTGPR